MTSCLTDSRPRRRSMTAVATGLLLATALGTAGPVAAAPAEQPTLPESLSVTRPDGAVLSLEQNDSNFGKLRGVGSLLYTKSATVTLTTHASKHGGTVAPSDPMKIEHGFLLGCALDVSDGVRWKVSTTLQPTITIPGEPLSFEASGVGITASVSMHIDPGKIYRVPVDDFTGQAKGATLRSANIGVLVDGCAGPVKMRTYSTLTDSTQGTAAPGGDATATSLTTHGPVHQLH